MIYRLEFSDDGEFSLTRYDTKESFLYEVEREWGGEGLQKLAASLRRWNPDNCSGAMLIEGKSLSLEPVTLVTQWRIA